MRILPALIGALLLIASSWELRAADPPKGQYARAEIRGTLALRTDTEVGLHIYKVSVGQGKTLQSYHLELPDDMAMKKSAKEWAGSDVEVTGDLQVELLTDFKKRRGTPYAAGLLRVKTFKKAPAAEKPKKELDGDAAKLIGTWKAISGEQYGKAMAEKDYGNFGIAIDENRLTYLSDGKKGLLHRYSIDPKAKPKTIDLHTVDTRALFSTEAIYELDGDTLKICFGVKKRPSEFKTTEDGKAGHIYVFKRQ